MPKGFWEVDAKRGAYDFFIKNIPDKYKNDYKYSMDESKEAPSKVQMIYSYKSQVSCIGPIKSTMSKTYFLKSKPNACFIISSRRMDDFGLFYEIESKPYIELRLQQLNYMSVKHFTSFIFWLGQIEEERVSNKPGMNAVGRHTGMNSTNSLVITTDSKKQVEYLGDPYTSFGPGVTDSSYANACGQLLEKFLGEKVQTKFTDPLIKEKHSINEQFKIVDFVLENYDESFGKAILYDCLSLIEYHNAFQYREKIEKLQKKLSNKSRLKETLYKLSIIDDLDLILKIAKDPKQDYKWAFRLLKKFPAIYLEALESWVFHEKFGYLSFHEMYKCDPSFAGQFFKKNLEYFKKSGLINHTTQMKF
ncbi:MAG: hypothetical protein NE330_22040 [Lentisphaeraceae bacterium]|nr:hypothetical protein [Lentisphaeraceae bacterium]